MIIFVLMYIIVQRKLLLIRMIGSRVVKILNERKLKNNVVLMVKDNFQL